MSFSEALFLYRHPDWIGRADVIASSWFLIVYNDAPTDQNTSSVESIALPSIDVVQLILLACKNGSVGTMSGGQLGLILLHSIKCDIAK